MKKAIISIIGVLLLGACAAKDNSSTTGNSRDQKQSEIVVHISHLNAAQFGDRPIGFLYAQEMLRAEGENAIPAMIDAVDSMDGFTIEQIKMILFKLPQSEAKNRAFSEINKERKKRIERSTRYSEREGWPAIPEIIHDQTVDWDLRSEAAKALMDKDQLKPTDLVPLLESPDIDDQKVAVTAINNQAFMDRGRRQIVEKTGTAKMRSSQIEKIAESDQEVLSPLLVNLLNSPDGAVVRRAALALGAFGNPEFGPALLEALPDAPAYGQEGIITALSDQKDTGAIKTLNILVVSGKNPYVRASAAIALEEFMDESSKDALKKATDDDAWLVRYHAAKALAKFSDPETKKVFGILSFDTNPTVQSFAKNMLGKLDNPMPPSKPAKGRRSENKEGWGYVIGDDTELAAALDVFKYNKGRFNEQAERLIRVINRLEERKLKDPASSANDRILFLSGLVKTKLAVIMWFALRDSDTVKVYYDEHKDEYSPGSMGEGQYLNADYQELTDKFPNSPLVEETAYKMAVNRTTGFHCERGIDCSIYRELNGFVPFFKEYPNSPKIPNLIDSINKYSLEDLITRPSEVYDLRRSAPFIREYYDAAKSFPDRDVRAKAFYPIARAFIVMKELDKADAIYQDLLANYSDLFDREKLEEDYDRLKGLMKG